MPQYANILLTFVERQRLENLFAQSIPRACLCCGLWFGQPLDVAKLIGANHRTLPWHLAASHLAADGQQAASVTRDKGRVHALGFSIVCAALPNNVGTPMLPMAAPHLTGITSRPSKQARPDKITKKNLKLQRRERSIGGII